MLQGVLSELCSAALHLLSGLTRGQRASLQCLDDRNLRELYINI